GKLGPEIDILERLPLEDVERAGGGLLREALSRLREGRVYRESGYDGEYGVIRLFAPEEIRGRSVVAPLFAMEEAVPSAVPVDGVPPSRPSPPRPSSPVPSCPPSPGEEGDGRLDPEQRAAVECVEGPLLIVAGPGTGKTRTLTHRIAHLIAERGVAPEQCLAVTFSRRAAAELEERLAALLPAGSLQPLVATFHGLGLTILREQAEAAGLASGFRVATPAERAEIVRELFALTPTKAERLLEGMGEVRCGRRQEAELAGRISAYEAALAERGLVDFDDLLLKPLALLRSRPDLAEAYRRRFPWISVDEYQDVDPLQSALLRILAPPGANLCAIGDPDQSIYGFRGADVGIFLRFRADYPQARVVHLTRNYRSTRTLVEAACQAIRPGTLVPGRRLVAVRDGMSERIVLQRAASERAEAELMVHTLERLVGGTSYFSFDSGRVGAGDSPHLSFADVAVLYRTEAQTPPLIEALGRAGIPFQKRSHRPLAEQAGVKALLAYFQGKKVTGERVEALLDRAVEELSVEGGAPGPSSLLAAADLLRPLAIRAGTDLEGFLAGIALGGEVDAWDPRAEGVSLLTLHAAKGLEFPVVFLVGCEEGILPFSFGSAGSEADVAEERRLFFVGITRARSRLFLFHSRRRTLRGETAEAQPSRFLADIEEALLDRPDEPVLAPRRPEQLRLL
ncbi:MAG TPA: UvrD-helicase domain-containing protein, partial [Thermoanaerobaculia bacterium]